MCTYLKNMEGKKLKYLKNKSFDYIKKIFDKAFKRVNTFVDFRTDLVEDKEEVAIDAVPLATKPPTIVDWKIHKEGKNNYFQIIRADESSKMYLVFSQLLKSVDREDLVELYKLVKAKYGSTRPVEDMDLLLWGNLKTMFEPHVEDEIWKLQQRYKVLSWKLFDSCGVHCLSLQSGMIYMLVENRYPLTPPTITNMLNKKLQYKVNAAEGVNAASEEVSTAELLKEFDLLKWDQQVVSELVALRNFARRYGSRFCTHGGCIQSSHAQTGYEEIVVINGNEEIGSKDDVHLRSRSIKATYSYSKLKDIFKASFKT
ncbi:hypothetical protein Tco_1042298 [Tanacetum coccineum]|uniref:Uncharacterized protein n=1 Tax=Tanacetum coccineum TaxID=301880 RepID=A0ABQ5GJC6_9ASTR